MDQNIQNLFQLAQRAHQASDLNKAENFYKKVLEQYPDNSGTLEYLGILYGQQNKPDEAVFYLFKAYEAEPENPVFCNNLGEALRRKGDFDRAIKFFKIAINIAPNFVEPYCNLGIVYKDKENHQEAINYYQMALNINPGHINSLQSLGNILLIQEKYSEALQYFRQVLKINPNLSNIYNNIAISLNKTGKSEEAVENYKQAIKLNPQLIEAHNNLGNLFLEIAREQEAAYYFSTVLKLEPENIIALTGLAELNNREGKTGEAIDIFLKIINIEPGNYQAQNTLGSLLRQVREIDLSLKHFEKSLEIKPDYIPALYNLSVTSEKQGNLIKAMQSYKKILSLKPDNDLLRLHIDTMSPVIYSTNEEVDQYRAKINEVLDMYIEKDLKFSPEDLHYFTGQTYYMLMYQVRDIDPLLREKFIRVFQKHFSPQKNILNPGKKHIAFLVTEGHENVFMKSVAGILNNLARNKYKYSVIVNKINGEKLIKPFVNNPEIEFIDLPTSLKDSVEVIGLSKVDILNFWEVGSDSKNFFLPFYRLAPIQTISWGIPLTTGNPNLDYFISAEHLEIAESDDFYVEKLIKFKNLPTYYYKSKLSGELKPRDYFNLSEMANVYFCSQTLLVIHPDFDNVVSKILLRDPAGIVIFLKDSQPYVNRLMQNRLEKNCSEVISRIKMVERMVFEEYLNLVYVSDVILNNFQFAGANTTFDALSLGKPVVTIPTQYFRGRFTYAAYKQMGITDCIAENEEDFIEKVVKLGTDKHYNHEIGSKILAKSDLLFENIETVYEHERFFEDVITNYKG